MSELTECQHPDDSAFLEDIEYNEDTKIKAVALTFKCGDCGSYYTRYWQQPKEKP